MREVVSNWKRTCDVESRARTSNDSGSGARSYRDGELLFARALADGLHQSSTDRLVETCQTQHVVAV